MAKAKVAEIKTKETELNVGEFIAQLPTEEKRKDSQVIIKMMEKATGDKAKIWGSSIIGFGNIRYKSPATGREVDWMKIGFSPRKAAITLYLMGERKTTEAYLKKLGKHKTNGGCIYINKLADVDLKVLEEMIKEAAKKK
jgi:hypothetical protein